MIVRINGSGPSSFEDRLGWQARVIANVKDGHRVVLENYDSSIHYEDCEQIERDLRCRFRPDGVTAIFEIRSPEPLTG